MKFIIQNQIELKNFVNSLFIICFNSNQIPSNLNIPSDNNNNNNNWNQSFQHWILECLKLAQLRSKDLNFINDF